ncbi:HAD family hydrolase [Candidatus Riflebacteria bacterium]
MKKQFSLIIFDLDGTLYAANEVIDRAFPRAAIKLAARCEGVSEAEISPVFMEKKRNLAEMIEGSPTNTLTLLYYFDVSFEDFEREVTAGLDIEDCLSLDERAIATLNLIAGHYPLALFTTNCESMSSRILKHLGLASFFPPENRFTLTHIGQLDLPGKEKLTFIKPGVKGYQYLLQKFNSVAEQTLMVGDSDISDIKPARALGINTYKIESRDNLYSLPAWLGL